MSQPTPTLPEKESRTAPLHLTDRPVELRFSFEGRQSSVGVGASMAAFSGLAVTRRLDTLLVALVDARPAA